MEEMYELKYKEKKEKSPHCVTNYFTVANFFTVSNLVFGFMAIVFLYKTNNERHICSAVFILLAAICDFFDGYVARKRNECSEFGKEFDSLADVLSFGLAPAAIFVSKHIAVFTSFLLISGAFYLISAALRLARFNVIDTADGTIKGLPTTVAGTVLSLKFISDYLLSREVTLLEDGIIIIVLSLLMLGNFTLRKIGYKRRID
jgi:CDP-diacylglycerol--serine O-phosphatidyltransferase